MKNRSRLLTVLLYIVVFAVAVVLISEVFFRDDTVYVNYSTVCEQFRSENVRSFEYDNGVLTPRAAQALSERDVFRQPQAGRPRLVL